MLVLVYFGCELLARIGFDVGDLAQFEHQNDDVFSFRVKNWFLDTGLVLSVLAVSFYIWAAAGGVNRKDEISAGAVALVVMLLWCIAVLYVNYWVDRWGRLPNGKVTDSAMSFEVMTVSTLPGGLLSTAEKSSRPKGPSSSLALGSPPSSIWRSPRGTSCRFGRVTNVEVRSPQAAYAFRRSECLARRAPQVDVFRDRLEAISRKRPDPVGGTGGHHRHRRRWFSHLRGLKELPDRSEKSIPPSRSPWAL